MSKIVYGVREIIASILGAFLFTFAEWAERYLISTGIIGNAFYDWVQFGILILTLTATLYGPVAGIICGVGGGLLLNVMSLASLSFPVVVSLGLFGLIMGGFYDKFKIRAGEFGGREYFDFAALSLFAEIASTVMVMPMLAFMIYGDNLFDTITMGVKSLVGNSVVTLVICGVILGIISFLVKCFKEKKNEI